jgi:hypothetical protein
MNHQDLLNAHVSIERAVYEHNKKYGNLQPGERPLSYGYILACVDDAIKDLRAYKKQLLRHTKNKQL